MVLPPKFSARAGLFAAEARRWGSVMVWQSARRLEEGGIQWLGHRLDAQCGIAPIHDSSPPTTMRSSANCSARRTATGGGQTVDVLRTVQASVCSSVQMQRAACSAVKVCGHAPSCFGWQWSRDPGRASSLSHRPPSFCSDWDIVAAQHPRSSNSRAPAASPARSRSPPRPKQPGSPIRDCPAWRRHRTPSRRTRCMPLFDRCMATRN
jgi:hypothetical protein